jgi:hypothetical protein
MRSPGDGNNVVPLTPISPNLPTNAKDDLAFSWSIGYQPCIPWLRELCLGSSGGTILSLTRPVSANNGAKDALPFDGIGLLPADWRSNG